jgi:hypothetical protein
VEVGEGDGRREKRAAGAVEGAKTGGGGIAAREVDAAGGLVSGSTEPAKASSGRAGEWCKSAPVQVTVSRREVSKVTVRLSSDRGTARAKGDARVVGEL